MSKPKVLFFDVETSYSLARIWRSGKQYVNEDQIVTGTEPNIICIAWKWDGDPIVYSLDWGIDAQNSEPMLDRFVQEVEKADLIIGQNSDKFDIKHINTQRMLKNKAPICWPTSEDTLKQLRKYFYLPSYKLNYISKLLFGTSKDKMTFQDWVDIVEKKDSEVLARMIRYCQKDVILLSRVYKRIKKYCTPKLHTNILLGTGRNNCPRCGGAGLSRGIRTTVAQKYRIRACKNCGHVYKGEKC